MAKKPLTEQPMPIRWEQILHVMPMHDWQLTPSALAIGYKKSYVDSQLVPILKRDMRFCKALEKKKAELASKYGIQTDQLVKGWLTAANSNIADFVTTDEDGNVRFVDFAEIPREKLAAVESIKISRSVTTKGVTATHTHFKLESKAAARESLGKIVGVFDTDNAQKRQVSQINVVYFHKDGVDAPNIAPQL